MDLDQAIDLHSEWRWKFCSAMAREEAMDALSIANDDGCELGKWLHGEAKNHFGHLASYARCVARHAAFHVEAGKVASIVNAGQYAQAEAMIGPDTPYSSASTAVRNALLALKEEAGI